MDDLEEYYNARKQIASHIDNSYSINGEKRNSRVPKPPKPGEIIYCQRCGLAMMPEDFSKDKKIRKKEFCCKYIKYCSQYLKTITII